MRSSSGSFDMCGMRPDVVVGDDSGSGELWEEITAVLWDGGSVTVSRATTLLR
jgi:hypothetical protein